MTLLAVSGNVALIILWVVFSACSLLAVTAVLVWAVRSGQFSNQDHCRRLPLESGIPKQNSSPSGKG